MTLHQPNGSEVTVGDGSALTGLGEWIAETVRYGDVTGGDIHDSIYPGINSHDTRQGVLHIPDGSTIVDAAPIAGYVRNDSAVTNGVALRGIGQATSDGAKVWGVNTLLQDAIQRLAGTALGRWLVGAELDFNVMNPDTEVIGISLGGNSLSQPKNANAFIANRFSAANPAIKWDSGFWSMDGAARYALIVGPAEPSGVNVPSQKILIQAFNAAGQKINAELRLGGDGRLNITGVTDVRVNGKKVLTQ